MLQCPEEDIVDEGGEKKRMELKEVEEVEAVKAS